MRFCVKSLKTKISRLYIIATTLVFVAVAISLMSGSANIGSSDIINLIKSGMSSTKDKIFVYVRMPRIFGALFTGAALSVSGAVIQNVLSNKLASPSIIGVNSGAGLAVTLSAAFGIYGGWQMSFFAFVGALCAVMLVSFGARKWGASRSTVILIGVAVNALLNAFSDIIITLDSNIGLLSNDFKIGDFSSVTYSNLIPAMVIVITTVFVLITMSNELDVLTLGDENATGLGVNVKSLRVLFLTMAALLAGVAVSVAGLLSFVGLIVPHAVRSGGVGRTRDLLPLCALFGGSFTVICDTLARNLFLPYEIPVGIIMSILGAPFFVFILIRGKGGHGNA